MSQKIGFAAIGVGGRMNYLLTLLLQAHGDKVELKAMADEAEPALGPNRTAFGHDIPAYTDYRKAIETPGVEWVLIGSRNDRHRDHCLAAFAAGKGVFCEKPLAVTIDQCLEVHRAHQASGKCFATGFVLRYAPMYQTIHQLVRDGQVGRVVSMEANEHLSADHGGYIMRGWRRHRSYTGSYIVEKCTHDIDLLCWMADSVPSRVASFGGTNIFTPDNKPVFKKLKSPDDKPPLFYAWPVVWHDADPFTSDKDVADNQVAVLEFRSGARASFHSNICTGIQERRMVIHGLEGSIRADLTTGMVESQRIGRKTERRTHAAAAGGGHGGADGIIMDELVRTMTTGAPPLADGEDGFISAVSCLAIDEAHTTGRIVDVEPYWKKFGV